MDREVYERLRIEFNKKSFKEQLKNTKEEKCVNCGSKNKIQFHHIVPLALGGTNNLENIVPLCCECHNKAHGAVNVSKLNHTADGRPKNKKPEGADETLMNYIYGRIGRAECGRLLGIGKSARVKEQWYFSELLKKRGIKKIKNTVDIAQCKKNKNGLNAGCRAVSVVYRRDA